MTNYVHLMDSPTQTETGVTVRQSCPCPRGDGSPCWVVRVAGQVVFHGPEAEALARQGREVQRMAVTVA